jgi:hypothetical protein
MAHEKHHFERTIWNISLKYMGEHKFMFKGCVVKRDGGRIGPRRRYRSSDLMVQSLPPLPPLHSTSDPFGQKAGMN